MTTADPRPAPSAAARGSTWSASGTGRLARLYGASRRTPIAFLLQAAFGALLAASLRGNWTIAGGPAARMLFPLIMIAGVAAVTAVCTHGPIGEAERATGRWLPWLRLAFALALTATAFGLLAAGAAGAHLPGGNLPLLRNIIGSVGLGLVSATVFGGSFGWIGPMAYLLTTEVALTGNAGTPWIWAARPPHDRGALICAVLVFTVGVIAVTVFGERGNHHADAGN